MQVDVEVVNFWEIQTRCLQLLQGNAGTFRIPSCSTNYTLGYCSDRCLRSLIHSYVHLKSSAWASPTSPLAQRGHSTPNHVQQTSRRWAINSYMDTNARMSGQCRFHGMTVCRCHTGHVRVFQLTTRSFCSADSISATSKLLPNAPRSSTSPVGPPGRVRVKFGSASFRGRQLSLFIATMRGLSATPANYYSRQTFHSGKFRSFVFQGCEYLVELWNCGISLPTFVPRSPMK